MKRSLHRSRDSFAQISWELVKVLEGDLTAAALFDWIAWKANANYGAPVDESGEAWYSISYKALSETTGISEKSARNALTKLVDLGHIKSATLKLAGPYDQTKAYAPIWEDEADKRDDPLPLGADGCEPEGESRSALTGNSSSLSDTADVSTSSSETVVTDLQPHVSADVVETKASPPSRPDVERLCSLLQEFIVANGVRKTAAEVTQKWRDSARLLLDRDKVPLAEAVIVLRWSQQDTFWRSNILSMPTFREKYDRLKLKAKPVPAAAGVVLNDRNRENLAVIQRYRQGSETLALEGAVS